MMDWNDFIQNDGNEVEFVLLPEGDYDFTVTNFERGEHPGSAKIPACHKAILELTIKTSNGVAIVRENLFLTPEAEWKLCQFFRSIGFRAHGQKVRMDWDKVVGQKGRAHIYVDSWTGDDGVTRQNNKVKKFLDQPKAFSFD